MLHPPNAKVIHDIKYGTTFVWCCPFSEVTGRHLKTTNVYIFPSFCAGTMSPCSQWTMTKPIQKYRVLLWSDSLLTLNQSYSPSHKSLRQMIQMDLTGHWLTCQHNLELTEIKPFHCWVRAKIKQIYIKFFTVMQSKNMKLIKYENICDKSIKVNQE